MTNTPQDSSHHVYLYVYCVTGRITVLSPSSQRSSGPSLPRVALSGCSCISQSAAHIIKTFCQVLNGTHDTLEHTRAYMEATQDTHTRRQTDTHTDRQTDTNTQLL